MEPGLDFDLETAEQETKTEQAETLEETDEGSESPEELAESEVQAEGDEQAEGERPPTIFITYNHNPNDSRVAARIYAELSQHYEVFVDQILPPAVDYESVAQLWLEKADFIIALISVEAIKSQFVIAELEDAYERYKTQGRPNVIPVRIDYAGPYGLKINAYIGRFHAIFWDNKDYIGLFEKLHAGINNKLVGISRSLVVGMDSLLVSETRRVRWAKTFVEPPELSGRNVMSGERRLLWVTGDAGVRNYVALALASRTKAEALYEVTKARKWSEINNTNVSDSAIVLRDALPAAHLDAAEEWHGLRAMIERNNIIIATGPDDEFEGLKQELHRHEFTDYEHLRLGRNSYNDEAKLNIFMRLLDHMFEAGEIEGSKYAWASELVKEPEESDPEPTPVRGRGRAMALARRQRESRSKFRENIRKWSPSDIERFVLSLPQIEKLSDIAKLLQRNAAIEDEIHSWFLALDDSTRCFVLTLAVFPELNNDQLWGKYKMVVDDLRRFDPGLRLLPFGVCRQRAHPNISIEGPIYLSDERVSEAIRQEVAKSYREYFIELTPRLKEWSVPPGRNAETQELKNQRRPKIEEGREVRVAIARMVGVVGRLGLDDLLDILDYWATDSNIHIRKSVAIALEQTAKSQTGINHALNLLEKWCFDITSPGVLRWRALAAAIALGSVTSAAPEPYVTFRALQCLGRLARSGRKDARFYASIALKQVTRYAPLSATEGILSRLAADERTEVRLNVAVALNEARAYDEEAAMMFSMKWALSENENRRWAALCGFVTSRRRQDGARPDSYQKLLELLDHEESAASLASVLSETVKDDHHGEMAKEAFTYLAREAKGRAWDNLAAGLSAVSLGKLENKLLPLLRSDGTPLMDERLIDVRREVLKRKMTEPARFLSTLKAWLNQERTLLEVFMALTLLLDEEPGGCRSQFVATLAECYRQDRAGMSEMLSRLEALASTHFSFLSQAVRREAFKRLLQDPPSFVALAYEDISGGETFASAREALEALVSDVPQGSREELFRALREGYALTPAVTKNLLRYLKTSDSPALARAAYEFDYRLMDEAISAPVIFPSLALELINEDGGRGEALSLLDYLAAPEPLGKRSALVRSLADARLNQAAGVDELLALPALKQWPHLASVPAEVARAFYVRRIFSRKFVTRLFSRK